MSPPDIRGAVAPLWTPQESPLHDRELPPLAVGATHVRGVSATPSFKPVAPWVGNGATPGLEPSTQARRPALLKLRKMGSGHRAGMPSG